MRSGKSTLHGNTHEHIVPKWLIKYLRIRNLSIGPTLREIVTDVVVDSRQHTVSNFLTGRVCAACNGGWMSDLENQTKPILTGLIEKPSHVLNLSESERFTIARWTLKIAAVLNHGSRCGDPRYVESRPVPNAHLKTLSSGAMPNDVLIVAGAYQSEDEFEFFQSTCWIWPKGSSALREEDKDRSYKIGVAFRGLMLAAIYYPDADYAYGLIDNGMYVPLWSGSRGIIPIHNCPAKTRTGSIGWRNRVNRHRSWMREVPVEWAFSQKA
jgi:hypothetical protein